MDVMATMFVGEYMQAEEKKEEEELCKEPFHNGPRALFSTFKIKKNKQHMYCRKYIIL